MKTGNVYKIMHNFRNICHKRTCCAHGCPWGVEVKESTETSGYHRCGLGDLTEEQLVHSVIDNLDFLKARLGDIDLDGELKEVLNSERKPHLLELLEKSITGKLTKYEAPMLISMLKGEITFIKELFDDGVYVVTIENTKGYETGIASKTIDVLCRKKNGLFQNVRTDEVYGSSVVNSKRMEGV